MPSVTLRQDGHLFRSENLCALLDAVFRMTRLRPQPPKLRKSHTSSQDRIFLGFSVDMAGWEDIVKHMKARIHDAADAGNMMDHVVLIEAHFFLHLDLLFEKHEAIQINFKIVGAEHSIVRNRKGRRQSTTSRSIASTAELTRSFSEGRSVTSGPSNEHSVLQIS